MSSHHELAEITAISSTPDKILHVEQEVSGTTKDDIQGGHQLASRIDHSATTPPVNAHREADATTISSGSDKVHNSKQDVSNTAKDDTQGTRQTEPLQPSLASAAGSDPRAPSNRNLSSAAASQSPVEHRTAISPGVDLGPTSASTLPMAVVPPARASASLPIPDKSSTTMTTTSRRAPTPDQSSMSAAKGGVTHSAPNARDFTHVVAAGPIPDGPTATNTTAGSIDDSIEPAHRSLETPADSSARHPNPFLPDMSAPEAQYVTEVVHFLEGIAGDQETKLPHLKLLDLKEDVEEAVSLWAGVERSMGSPAPNVSSESNTYPYTF